MIDKKVEQLTEERIREIVREEIEKSLAQNARLILQEQLGVKEAHLLLGEECQGQSLQAST